MQETQVEPTDDAPDEPILTLTDVGSFEAASSDTVPPTYQRLFAPAPVDIDEFFVARKHETARFNDAFERFAAGNGSSVLVLGEGGSGKTSFIDHCVRKLETDLPVDRMAFTHNFQTERQLAIQLGELLGHRSNDLDRLRARLRCLRVSRFGRWHWPASRLLHRSPRRPGRGRC